MASPGSFAAGGVLTAADMNGLPGGLLASGNNGGDYTITTGGVDLGDFSVTLTASRTLLITGYLPQLDNPSTTLNVSTAIYDGPIATGAIIQQSWCSIGSSSPSNIGIVIHRQVYAAGTHTFYFAAKTSTGTARVNGGGASRRYLFTIQDVGPG